MYQKPSLLLFEKSFGIIYKPLRNWSIDACTRGPHAIEQNLEEFSGNWDYKTENSFGNTLSWERWGNPSIKINDRHRIYFNKVSLHEKNKGNVKVRRVTRTEGTSYFFNTEQFRNSRCGAQTKKKVFLYMRIGNLFKLFLVRGIVSSFSVPNFVE